MTTTILAPVAIFAYKRPDHTARLLRSFSTNPEHATSPVYVFCDGTRTPQDETDVGHTRQVVRELAPSHAHIIERGANMGLANSIITGVTQLTREHGKAIILEDDLVLAPFALRYFNDALVRYRNEERVMHVSAYMFPVDARLPETFLYREATCWGWATWARAWSKFEPDGKRIRDEVIAREMRYEFDVQSSMGFFGMLEAQIARRIDSWAIRWYGSMRLAGGLALHPGVSLVQNLGFDGTGEHCSENSAFDVRVAKCPVTRFTDRIEEDEKALAAMIAYRRKIWGAPTMKQRARNLLRRIAGWA
jgi:hypothetical protein